MLLNGRFLEIPPERLDIGRDMERLDIGELAKLVMFAPREEPTTGMEVSRAGVIIPNGDAEEFQVAARGRIAGISDDRRCQFSKSASAVCQSPIQRLVVAGWVSWSNGWKFTAASVQSAPTCCLQ